MIDFSAVSEALRAQLQGYSAFSDLMAGGMEIRRGDYINNDPNRCPWAGVYRGDRGHTPKTLGRNARNWQGVLQLRVVVQASSMDSGQDCEDRLENLVKHAIDGIFSDYTIGGTVDMLTGLRVEYAYNEAVRESVYLQMATIILTGEVRTQ